MSDMPKRIWAGPYEPSDGFMGGQYCNGYEGMSYATEYIRADIAEHRQAELLKLLSIIVDRKWSIASPVQTRPDNYNAATHLMCSIEKQVIDRARAITAKHEQEESNG